MIMIRLKKEHDRIDIWNQSDEKSYPNVGFLKVEVVSRLKYNSFPVKPVLRITKEPTHPILLISLTWEMLTIPGSRPRMKSSFVSLQIRPFDIP